MATQESNRQAQSNALQTSSGQSSTLSRRNNWNANPFSLMRRMSDEMDRMFENFFGRGGLSPWSAAGMQGMWQPQIEMFQRGDQLVIQADLPGMKKEDLEVQVVGDTLVLQGERKQEQERQEQGFYRSERSYGSFYRSIPLPEGVNPDEIQASFKDGVLEISMKAPQQQPQGRKIEIRQ